jgi:hypothetical protein
MALAAAAGDGAPPGTSPPHLTTTSAATTTTLPPPAAPFTPRPPEWYVISVTRALPEGLTADIEMLDDVDVVSTVRVGTVNLVETTDLSGSVVDRAPRGFFLPLEVHVIDVEEHRRYVPPEVARVLGALGADQAVLSRSSAAFRRIGLGGQLRFDRGGTFTVIGIVADEWIGSAEAVVSPAGGDILGVSIERYALVRHDGSGALLEHRANQLTDKVVRVRSRNQVDTFRHADAVASQIAIKTRFGEFAYRPIGGGNIEIDPEWVKANIVYQSIPLLGSFPCHREFTAMLGEVMTELETEGNGDVIDRRRFRGCWNARFIRNRRDLSRHSWGVAADINFGADRGDEPGSPTHTALLEAMLAREILSGHVWSNPDPGHFEWFGDA